MTATGWTAPKAAIRLNKLVDVYCTAHGLSRFPVNVERLALEAAGIFGWRDPITRVQAASIPGFEGCLSPNDDRTQWLLLYNDRLPSQGRIRFTQAHELGHYILHRMNMDVIECGELDMLDWSSDEKSTESQADNFASYLLMPLDDYREQISTPVNLEVFKHCANRYGVSLTAAILKWISYTNEKALILKSTDGYINWAYSSDPAFKSGAFIKTRGKVVALPTWSVAANSTIKNDNAGISVAAKIWFPHAEEGESLREMKLSSDHYGSILTLLCLPKFLNAWAPRTNGGDD